MLLISDLDDRMLVILSFLEYGVDRTDGVNRLRSVAELRKISIYLFTNNALVLVFINIKC